MPNLENTKQLYRDFSDRVRKSPALLLGALETAGNNYSQNFGNQILIYGQKPDAVEVATYDEWKKKGTHVNYGSHGFKLISPGAREAQTVFDIKDTALGKAERWNLEGIKDEVLDNVCFDRGITQEAADRFDNIGLLVDAVRDEIGTAALSDEAQEASKQMASAIVLFRLGADKETVQRLTDLSGVSSLSPADFNRAGASASMVAKETLDTIRNVAEKVRSENERSISQGKIAGRDGSSGIESQIPESKHDEAPGLRDQQIQENEGEIPSGETSGRDGDNVYDRRTGREPVSDGHSSTEDVREDLAGLSGSERSDRGTESEGSAPLGGALQSGEEAGRGSSSERIDIRISRISSALGLDRDTLKAFTDGGVDAMTHDFAGLQRFLLSADADRAYSAYKNIGRDIENDEYQVKSAISKDVIQFIISKGENTFIPDDIDIPEFHKENSIEESKEDGAAESEPSVSAVSDEEKAAVRAPKEGDIVRFTDESRDNDGKLYRVERYDGYSLTVNMVDPVTDEDRQFARKQRFGGAEMWSRYLEYVDDYKPVETKESSVELPEKDFVIENINYGSKEGGNDFDDFTGEGTLYINGESYHHEFSGVIYDIGDIQIEDPEGPVSEAINENYGFIEDMITAKVAEDYAPLPEKEEQKEEIPAAEDNLSKAAYLVGVETVSALDMGGSLDIKLDDGGMVNILKRANGDLTDLPFEEPIITVALNDENGLLRGDVRVLPAVIDDEAKDKAIEILHELKDGITKVEKDYLTGVETVGALDIDDSLDIQLDNGYKVNIWKRENEGVLDLPDETPIIAVSLYDKDNNSIGELHTLTLPLDEESREVALDIFRELQEEAKKEAETEEKTPERDYAVGDTVVMNDGTPYFIASKDGDNYFLEMLYPLEGTGNGGHWDNTEHIDRLLADGDATISHDKQYMSVGVYLDTIVNDYDSARYGDNEYVIDVERGFLDKWVGNIEHSGVYAFMKNYTYDDTMSLYNDAKDAGALKEDYEEAIEREFPAFHEGDVIRDSKGDRFFVNEFKNDSLVLRPIDNELYAQGSEKTYSGEEEVEKALQDEGFRFERHGVMMLEEEGVVSLDNGDKMYVQESSDEGYVDYTIYTPDENGIYSELDGGVLESTYGETTVDEVIEFAYLEKEETPAFVSFEQTDEDPYLEDFDSYATQEPEEAPAKENEEIPAQETAPATAAPSREVSVAEFEDFCNRLEIDGSARTALSDLLEAKKNGKEYSFDDLPGNWIANRKASDYGYENYKYAARDFIENGMRLEERKAAIEADRKAKVDMFTALFPLSVEKLGVEDSSFKPAEDFADNTLIYRDTDNLYKDLHNLTGRHLNYNEAREVITGLWNGITKDPSFDYNAFIEQYKGEDKPVEAFEITEQTAPDGGDIIPVGTVVMMESNNIYSYQSDKRYYKGPQKVEYVDYDNGVVILRDLTQKDISGATSPEEEKPLLHATGLDLLRRSLSLRETSEEHRAKRFDKHLTELCEILGEEKGGKKGLKAFIDDSPNKTEPYAARLTKRVDDIIYKRSPKTAAFFDVEEGELPRQYKVNVLLKQFIGERSLDLTAYKAFSEDDKSAQSMQPDYDSDTVIIGQEIPVYRESGKIAYDRYPSETALYKVKAVDGDKVMLAKSNRYGKNDAPETVYVSLDDVKAYTAWSLRLNEKENRSKGRIGFYGKDKDLTTDKVFVSETLEEDIFAQLAQTRQVLEDILDPAAKEKREAAKKAREEKAHYQTYIPSADEIARAATPRELALDNIAALKVLRAIEADGHKPTIDEKDALSKYHGWGGCAVVFDERDGKRPVWAQGVNEELKTLLSDDEYRAARSTVNDAFYTDSFVIREMYATLNRMGFESGNILEPSCGVGSFFGGMPSSMADGSKVYGVEIDPLTAKIAKTLYPENTIGNTGFEKTAYNDDSFDLAIGNVPFGDITMRDGVHDDEKLLIHDYFFQKALDKVRPGGIVAFITSSGTMDKRNDRVRRSLAERAELIGAVRLPNTAFSGAGTSVTSDVIFLKKRETPIDLSKTVAPDWVQIGADSNGLPINRYFAEHPENIAGVMQKTKGIHGSEQSTCVPVPGKTWRQGVQDAMKNITGLYLPEGKTLRDVEDEKDEELSSFTPYSFGQKKDGTFIYRDGDVLYKAEEVSNAYAKERAKDPDKADGRMAAFIDLRKKAYEVINIQLTNASEEEIEAKQQLLNEAYDSFAEKYGRVNDKTNKPYFQSDETYALVSSLEILDSKGNFVDKADIFTKRTIEPHKVVDHVDTSREALLLSIQERGRIDWRYMEELTGKEMTEMVLDLNGSEIFYDPDLADYVTADEYLSGNVRKKLETAKEQAESDPELEKNVLALQEVQPALIDAVDITVNPGSPWLDPKYIEQFVNETLGISSAKVEHSPVNNQWKVTGGGLPASAMVYGTDKADPFEIITDVLNMQSTTITYTEGTGEDKKRVVDQDATLNANAKQDTIREAFQAWIWKDPERRRELVELYNSKYNCYVPRKYDGSKLTFPGMNPAYTLNDWQKDGVARILYGGNTLLAHVVGAGKTFTMVTAAMEEKRLGLVKKSLFVVPNHLTEQWGADFKRLYPSSNVLVVSNKDFSTDNRRKTFARIATGNYDAIIIGHSQIGMIPLNNEREKAFVQSEIDMYVAARERLVIQEGENSLSVKEIEKMIRKLKKKLEDLDKQANDRGLLTFEQLGVEKLYVDESHEFKNLYTLTRHSGVAGIQTSEAQKALNLLSKIRYMDSITGGKGTVFATGTPISNSMTELYTNMRYLQNDLLNDMGISDFDSWVTVFGNIKDELTLNPEGGSFKMRTVCSSFNNLPELVHLFSGAADVRTADMIELKGVPDVEYINVEVERSDEQAEIIERLGVRAESIRNGAPQNILGKKGLMITDNMLAVTGEGRKAALDQRLVDPDLPDDPASKLNKCVDNVFEIWSNSKDFKGAQLIFCDQGTPKGKPASSSKKKAEETEVDNTDKDAEILDVLNQGSFCVYDEIKAKLEKLGIPAEQIAYIHDYPKPEDKKKLYDKVNSGEIRVLLGSTAKMGAGMNVQERLVALHHVDVPWRPSDIEQREGRIIRQGNELIKNGTIDKVKVFKYITKDTFDSYSWELISRKLKSIGQVMTSKEPSRTMEDVSAAALQANEAIALSLGDPRIKEFMELKATTIPTLEAQKNAWTREHHEIEDKVTKIIPEKMKADERYLTLANADIETVEKNSGEFAITVCDKEGDIKFTDAPVKMKGKDGREYEVGGRKAGFSALFNAAMKAGSSTAREKIGEYRGLEIHACSSGVYLKGEGLWQLKQLGKLPETIEKNLDALIDDIKDAIPRLEGKISQYEKDLEYYKTRIDETFPKEEEYQKSLERYQELEMVYAKIKAKKEEGKEEKEAASEDAKEDKTKRRKGKMP